MILHVLVIHFFEENVVVQDLIWLFDIVLLLDESSLLGMRIICLSSDLCRKIQPSVIDCLTVFVVFDHDHTVIGFFLH